MKNRNELGQHLRRSAEQVRAWPKEQQRSQAIRNQSPPRHASSSQPPTPPKRGPER
jgi:hypothetical protein